jgi:hypothetical protein
MRRSPRRQAARKDSCTSAGQLSGVRMRIPRASSTSLRSASAKMAASVAGSAGTRSFRVAIPSLRARSGTGKGTRSHRIVFAVPGPREDSVRAIPPGAHGLVPEQDRADGPRDGRRAGVPAPGAHDRADGRGPALAQADRAARALPLPHARRPARRREPRSAAPARVRRRGSRRAARVAAEARRNHCGGRLSRDTARGGDPRRGRAARGRLSSRA